MVGMVFCCVVVATLRLSEEEEEFVDVVAEAEAATTAERIDCAEGEFVKEEEVDTMSAVRDG